MSRSDVIDITVSLRMERDDSIAIFDGKHDKNGREVWVWLPKSLIDYRRRGPQVEVQLPEWLAVDRERV